MTDDVLLNKCEIIERCLIRIKDIYQNDPTRLHQNFDTQDAIILNVERACQATIDSAMRIVRIKKLGIPKDSRDSFIFLEKAGLIEGSLADRLKKMVGFRNIAIHDYQTLNLKLLQTLIESNFPDLRDYIKIVITID